MQLVIFRFFYLGVGGLEKRSENGDEKVVIFSCRFLCGFRAFDYVPKAIFQKCLRSHFQFSRPSHKILPTLSNDFQLKTRNFHTFFQRVASTYYLQFNARQLQTYVPYRLLTSCFYVYIDICIISPTVVYDVRKFFHKITSIQTSYEDGKMDRFTHTS